MRGILNFEFGMVNVLFACAWLSGAACGWVWRDMWNAWRRRRRQRLIDAAKKECDRWLPALNRLHVWRNNGEVGLLMGLGVGAQSDTQRPFAFGMVLMRDSCTHGLPLAELRLALPIARQGWPEHFPQEGGGQ